MSADYLLLRSFTAFCRYFTERHEAEMYLFEESHTPKMPPITLKRCRFQYWYHVILIWHFHFHLFSFSRRFAITASRYDTYFSLAFLDDDIIFISSLIVLTHIEIDDDDHYQYWPTWAESRFFLHIIYITLHITLFSSSFFLSSAPRVYIFVIRLPLIWKIYNVERLFIFHEYWDIITYALVIRFFVYRYDESRRFADDGILLTT